MKKTAYFTICARNYLAYALTLRDSLLSVEPQAAVYIFLADEPAEGGLPDDVEPIPAEALGKPELRAMAFRYSLMEFSTAIKAWCFQHVLTVLGHERAVYLDPDIQVFQPLLEVEAAFDAGASAVLTPHLLKPLRDPGTPTDLDILRSGTFNLGFACFARTEEALAFLDWWAEKLVNHCRVDLENGLFVDQKFVEFAPSLIEKLSVLRHPGYNVAYWNLSNRAVSSSRTGWTVDGEPLVFFHFSGVVPGNDTVFSKHQSRFDMAAAGLAADLVRDYLKRLTDNGHANWSATPYAFGNFRSGESILPPMRRLVDLHGDADDWFAAPDLAYWTAPSERVDQQEDCLLTRLMVGFHALRPDLQAQFPLAKVEGRREFRDWFITHGAREYGLDEIYLRAAKSGAGSDLQVKLRQVASRLASLRP